MLTYCHQTDRLPLAVNAASRLTGFHKLLMLPTGWQASTSCQCCQQNDRLPQAVNAASRLTGFHKLSMLPADWQASISCQSCQQADRLPTDGTDVRQNNSRQQINSYNKTDRLSLKTQSRPTYSPQADKILTDCHVNEWLPTGCVGYRENDWLSTGW